MKHLIALPLLLLATPLAAQDNAANWAVLPEQKTQALTPEIQEKALKLAAILNSEDIIVGQSDDNAKNMALGLTQALPELAEMESESPGILSDIADAILPIINRSLRTRLPTLQERQAALYAKTFDASELDYLIGFYGSPTGQKIVKTVTDNLSPEEMMKEGINHPDFKISGDAALKDVRRTVANIDWKLTAEDGRALQIFQLSSAFPKLQRIAGQTQQITLDWADESEPGEDEAIEAALTKVIEQYEKTGK